MLFLVLKGSSSFYCAVELEIHCTKMFCFTAAVFILLYYFFTHLKPSSNFPAIGQIENIPLYFGTVLFAFEGVAVV